MNRRLQTGVQNEVLPRPWYHRNPVANDQVDERVACMQSKQASATTLGDDSR